MLEYINNNLSGFWIAIGFTMLAAEVLLFGFTTIIFLFAGLGALITGLLMEADILPQTWIAGTSCFGITTGICSAILWKPLKKMQDAATPQKRQKSDIVGYEFVLAEDITAALPGKYRYSGIDWKVEIDHSSGIDSIAKGERVVVTSVDVGVLRVEKAG